MEEANMPGRTNTDIGLLLLRLALGAIMIAHGLQKAFGMFGGPGPEGVVGMVSGMGFKPPQLWAWLLIAAELGGGIGLVLGFLTPLCALGVIISQLVAVFMVHGPHGFFLSSGGAVPGFEFNLALLGAAFCLLLTGPGRISVDYPLFGARRRRDVVVEPVP
jgi:putative oxidoreductase